MKKPCIYAVIGKNFGDEGKGLAVDFLASQGERSLVIRHNGGAQSGHTVDLPDNRFVFHELSSGSFRGADTLWVATYFPDLYKLGEEVEDFRKVSGLMPIIYAQPEVQITLIDDVLLNMAAEEARGEARHGSCGMGIYEAQCRSEAGFGVTLGELWCMNKEAFVERLADIRRRYLPERLRELGLEDKELGEYGEMLANPTVLENVATIILQNLRFVQPVEDILPFLNSYQRVIFENGQGLLLDSENERYSPHVTASRTGLVNPCAFLRRYGYELQEVIYVTRSYVTRHGEGELPYECTAEKLGIEEPDLTNVENKWQGKLRYARHGSVEEFVQAVEEDLDIISQYSMEMPVRTLMITHLNETADCILSEDGAYPVEDFCGMEKLQKTFDVCLCSASHYAEQIKMFQIHVGNDL